MGLVGRGRKEFCPERGLHNNPNFPSAARSDSRSTHTETVIARGCGGVREKLLRLSHLCNACALPGEPPTSPVHTAACGSHLSYNSAVRSALAIIVLIGSSTARADGERAVSVSLGWSTFSVPGKAMGNQAPPTVNPDVGGMLGASYEHSVSTDISLRGELAGGVFYGGGTAMQGKTSYALLGDAGVAFRFDVLKYVPYAFAGLGAVTAGGGPIDRGSDFVLVIGGGLDWLQSRERSYGVEARVASFGGDITVVSVGVRGTVRWGFF